MLLPEEHTYKHLHISRFVCDRSDNNLKRVINCLLCCIGGKTNDNKKNCKLTDKLIVVLVMSHDKLKPKVLVDTQEVSIWSIVLRCDQIYLLITQDIFLRAMVAPGTRTFVYPPRHRACPLIFICSEKHIEISYNSVSHGERTDI